MLRKILATVLVLMMALAGTAVAETAAFNAEGYPIVNEPITLRVLVGNSAASPADYNDLQIIQEIEQKTGIHIEWIMAGSGLTEKRSVMLATGDLPDIILKDVTATELVTYGENGTFIPMQDLIKQYAPNVTALFEQTEGLEGFVTAPDGNIYGVPRMNAAPWTKTNGIGMINTKWLENLGLEMPATIDEFYNVLKAFKEQDANQNGDPNDEIPMAFGKWLNSGATTLSDVNGISYLMSAFGVPMGVEYMDVQNGKVTCIATTENYKQGIAYLSKMYTEGLIDIESFTMSREQLDAKISQTPYSVGYIQGWDIADEFSTDDARDNYDFMPPLKGTDGSDPVVYQVPLYGISRGACVITSACQYPEAAMRWIDYLYDTMISIQICEGPIGVRVGDKGDGTYEVLPAPEGMNSTQWKDGNALGGYGAFAITPDTFTNVLRFPSTDAKVAFMTEYMDPYADTEAFPSVYYTVAESEEVALLRTDLLSYIERRASDWIMNGGIEEQWDSYVNELGAMGLSRLMEINQAAYDRYIGK